MIPREHGEGRRDVESSLLSAFVVLPLRSLLPPLALSLFGCGGSNATSPGPEAVASASAVPDSPSSAAPKLPPGPVATMPAACAEPSTDVCTPPPGFVERLCATPHQDLALGLFARSSPFTRLYLRGRVDELSFDEEVLALRFHAQPKGGIQVGSGSGSYDVLRWDGSCSRAVDADMITRDRPSRPKTARILWHRLDDRTQTALITGSDAIKLAHSKRGKECKGAMSGDVSAACEKADATLGAAIVKYVRDGGSLPDLAPP